MIYLHNPFVFSLLFFTGICFVHSGKSYHCPLSCRCTNEQAVPGTVSVICYFTKLKSDDYPIFSKLAAENTTYLYIKCNLPDYTTSLANSSPFKHLTNLRKLIFETCYINNLPENIFAGLDNLRNLTIYKSKYLNVNSNAFVNLPNLETLRINNCDSVNFPVNSLCHQNKLTTLNLAENNIKNISEVFNLCLKNSTLLNNITVLVLNHNKLSVIPDSFSDIFKSVQYILLQNNKIESVQQDAFSNLHNLEYINLSNNSLSKLPQTSFNFSYKLYYFDISNNPIKEMPITLQNLSNIQVFTAKNTLLGDRIWNFLNRKSLVLVNFENCGLTFIPEFVAKLQTLKYFLLDKNNITTIRPNVLAASKSLILLRLSGNKITSLPKFAFKGLDSLETLYLNDNQISIFDENVFLSLSKLTILDLSTNSLSHIPKLPLSMQVLDLRQNNIKKISSELNTAKNLEYLVLKDNAIEIIENDAFSQLQSLQILNLKNNNITNINNNPFKNLHKLWGLNIAFNNIKELRHGTISHLQLREFYCRNNQLTTLSKAMFPKSLRLIDLSHNYIKFLTDDIVHDMNHLTELNLRSNHLSTVKGWNFLRSANAKPIRILLLGNSFKCDCHLTWLKEAIMWQQKYTYATKLFDMVFCDDYEPWLPIGSLDTVNINDLLCDYYKSLNSPQKYYCTFGCECCFKLESCSCENICPLSCLCLFSLDRNLHKVDCRKSNLTQLTRIPSAGTHIDLSGNKLNYLYNTNFTDHSAAEVLYMNNSQILIVANKTFITFTSLKKLYLQNNFIEALQQKSFEGLKNLLELILYNNKIQYIPENTFSETPKLKYLDLRNNKLQTITSEMFSSKALQKMYLIGNPWSCECNDASEFEKIYANDTELLANGEQILCKKYDDTLVNIFKHVQEFCQNNVTHNITRFAFRQDKVLISTMSAVSSVVVLILIITIVLYVYRQEIQLLIFIHFGYRFMSKKLIIDEENKLYDAFVSFDNSLDLFVLNELLPQLEQNDPPYKLCVHFRDFEVGLQITENIINSIENSKRTILLITDNFLKSEWCKYEFQTAHYDGLSQKMNTLIVVLFENINEELLDPDLKLYLKTKTYLKYDDPSFWNKLRFALPAKKDFKQETKC
ncbi:toll-like receptor Tollo [Octopus vulgaris]|uniref:Toll-like receptor Tollo n=1 Tax=Octopus vulgaris TaxID=6645 RepID=A0AA36EYR9_OCTVU|nr:toll-like receptor Tollo [Octopus vulgaris]